MHLLGNFTTIVLPRTSCSSLGAAKGCSRTCAASQELGEWQEGQISCRNTGDMAGLGAWGGLVLMENCRMNSPALHLPTENPLFPVLWVTTAAPQKSSSEGWFCCWGDRVRRRLRKRLQERRSALTQRGQGRDSTETGLSVRMHGHSHHWVCILLPGQVPPLGNCLLSLCLKPRWRGPSCELWP